MTLVLQGMSNYVRTAYAWGAIGLALLATGCTYHVALETPETYPHPYRLPMDVGLVMSETVRRQTYEFRGQDATYVVPVGAMTWAYAKAYLSEAFRSFRVLPSAEVAPPGSWLIRIDDAIGYSIGSGCCGELHSSLVASVIAPSGKEALRNEYGTGAPTSFVRLKAPIIFTSYPVSSAIRASTHVAFATMFQSLVDDIRAKCQGWTE